MKGRNEVAPRPWKAERRLFSDGSFGFFLRGGVTTAEANLIAEAVNNHDRLRAIDADAASTPFGFRMGQIEVTRAARLNGYVVIFVETDHQRIEITATPKGRYLRVLGPYQRADR